MLLRCVYGRGRIQKTGEANEGDLKELLSIISVRYKVFAMQKHDKNPIT